MHPPSRGRDPLVLFSINSQIIENIGIERIMTNPFGRDHNNLSAFRSTCFPYRAVRVNGFEPITLLLLLTYNALQIIVTFKPTVVTGGRALSAGLSIDGAVVQSHLPPFRNLDNFVHLTLPVSFRKDTKSRWSFYLVSFSGEVKYTTRGVNN